MKLFYYEDEVGNFGDDLNPWLWDRLLPGFFDDDESEWLVGIGTLLNHKLPAKGKKYVLGSGYGYGELPKIDESFHFFCVRGPKTAQALGLDPALALTDPAILLATVAPPKPAGKRFRVGFVPHFLSVRAFSWETICQRLGFNFINPEWSVDRVLAELQQCEVVLCEAMHGAIACDALRIPWIPVCCYDSVNSFKWEDWLLTVNLPYEPLRINSLYDAERRLPPGEKLKNSFKRMLRNTGVWSRSWYPPCPAVSSAAEIQQAQQALLNASNSRTYLSEDAIHQQLITSYQRVLDQVRALKR